MTRDDQHETPDQQEDAEPQGLSVKQRRLTAEERRNLDQTAKPGAVYMETHWKKRARESLRRIERAVDELEAPNAPRAIARKRRARGSDLPGGLRSRVSEALGPIAYVQLVYSTREHHVCHVGRRQEDEIENVIVLVGADEVRAFDEIQAAIDALEAVETPEPVPEGPDPFGRVYEIEEVEGIGETYTRELAELGIEDTRQLWRADPGRVAASLEVSPKTVALWKRMVELMAIDGIGPQYAELLARSGVEGIEDLADADAEELLEAIETKQKDLMVRIQGNVIRTDRAQGWIDKASQHEPEED